MRVIRTLLYRLGFRPRPGSVFFSPSANLVYRYRDALRRLS